MIALCLALCLAQDDPLESASKATARVVEKLRASVVSVRTSPGLRTSLDYFRNRGEVKAAKRRGTPKTQAGGSGVVYAQGFVLTNYHVVEGASAVSIGQGDKTWEARIVGVDPLTDLAVLKAPDCPLPEAPLGDSRALAVGEWVVAIGDPYVFDRSVTFGIVSAKHRTGVGLAFYEQFLQVDCAINPGNSGGLLADVRGRVVGITTGYYSEATAFSGVGFAIPIHQAREVARRLEKDGRMKYGSLGVEVQDFGGVVVTDAESDVFAPGDVVVAVGGKPVGKVVEYLEIVSALAPGSKVKVRRRRSDEEGEIEVPVVEQSVPDFGTEFWSGDGLVVQELTPWLARELNMSGEKGVIVARVDAEVWPDLQVGDVVKRVGSRRIVTVEDFRKAMEKADGDLFFRSGNRHRFTATPR